MEKGKWTFLSNHGRVFVYLSKNPHSTTEMISREVGLSLRGVQKIITDLEKGVESPRWSQDGKRILFLSDVERVDRGVGRT